MRVLGALLAVAGVVLVSGQPAAAAYLATVRDFDAATTKRQRAEVERRLTTLEQAAVPPHSAGGGSPAPG